ncbi:hypothetical protein BB561_004395 [Smittium simulii]|uniref:Gamma-glutamyltransferase n=1 Tax=Smittium simulii TaxID=133385 RepID=A0A2T9YGE5_9FUNG|nr:hypothetical protein BB561_004395 [Smittium simulii]
MYPGMREHKLKSMNFSSRKATVYGTRYAVSSSQQIATQVGMDILANGGNAADAAIAVAATLAITEPCSTGLGGDCFCLFYNAKEKKVYALNGSGRSAMDSSLQSIKTRLGPEAKSIPFDDIEAITVPGAAAGWVDTIENFGSGKYSLSQLLEPAIEYAQDGYPVSEIVAQNWASQLDELKAASPNYHEVTVDGNRGPNQGEIFKNPTYADTLKRLAKDGKDGFYKGFVAEAIVKVIQERGGKITLEDLASHKSTIVEPIHLDYKGYSVYECPPNGQGIVALEALGILDSLVKLKVIPEISQMQHNSSEYLHAIIESLRLAFSDAFQHVGDPDLFPDFNHNSLLSKEYLDKRSSEFSPLEKNNNIVHGYPISSSDTVYFCTLDEQGNGCSFINSNYTGFGCVVPKGCGFTLQNRGSNFSLTDNSNAGGKNVYEPGKRPYHTIIPSLITKDDELFAVFGVMGGFMQPQGHLQVFLNMIEFGMEPQVALDAPRVCIDPNEKEENVLVEDGISCAQELQKLGHKIELVCGAERSAFGRGQIIQRQVDDNQNVVLSAGCDPRSDGCSSAR